MEDNQTKPNCSKLGLIVKETQAALESEEVAEGGEQIKLGPYLSTLSVGTKVNMLILSKM